MDTQRLALEEIGELNEWIKNEESEEEGEGGREEEGKTKQKREGGGQ